MSVGPKKNINHLALREGVVGNERRVEILDKQFAMSTLLPKPVVYEDIDNAFKEFIKSIEMVSDEGTVYPTMTLFSNQRFSEYSQTWKYTDKNNNILLNFKTVMRENNPQYGKIVGAGWNIPGDNRFYLMKRVKVLDDNGSESFLDLKVRQPMPVDLVYKTSIFTNKYQSLNKYNESVNELFRSRQQYVCPNGYYMPMMLEAISDESEYSIDDRQFYSQTFTIKLMGYIVREEDFRVDEIPLKRSVTSPFFTKTKRKKADVEIEECELEPKEGYDFVPLKMNVTFPGCVNTVSFIMDEDFTIERCEYENLVSSCRIFVNDEEVFVGDLVIIRQNDNVRVKVRHKNPLKDGRLTIIGHDPNNVEWVEGGKPMAMEYVDEFEPLDVDDEDIFVEENS
jgi:hypothetical protein